jgi:hypothetical protein
MGQLSSFPSPLKWNSKDVTNVLGTRLLTVHLSHQTASVSRFLNNLK